MSDDMVTYSHCKECGCWVAHGFISDHKCEDDKLVAYQASRLGVELKAYLASPAGKFAQHLAKRETQT